MAFFSCAQHVGDRPPPLHLGTHAHSRIVSLCFPAQEYISARSCSRHNPLSAEEDGLRNAGWSGPYDDWHAEQPKCSVMMAHVFSCASAAGAHTSPVWRHTASQDMSIAGAGIGRTRAFGAAERAAAKQSRKNARTRTRTHASTDGDAG